MEFIAFIDFYRGGAAKEYVANKLGRSVFDLSDSAKMRGIREFPDIRIPSVELFIKQIGR